MSYLLFDVNIYFENVKNNHLCIPCFTCLVPLLSIISIIPTAFLQRVKTLPAGYPFSFCIAQASWACLAGGRDDAC